MKSKFHDIYNLYITEQDAPAAPEPPPAPEPPANAGAAPTIDNQQPEAKLDTDGFVTLVRLLKDAFVVKPSTEDADSIIDIGEINAVNAYDKFKKILDLIKKYNPDVDVNIDDGKKLVNQL
tara:strand:+ start:300 stop:662 length:363 start_codon:yes stop_codon:yes gene_type:complete